uniref:BTB domain-containing protein n=1 Tax=Emiliania huxleyi TaxID=2903 RepID=A0A7S3U170_EMIHU|mmetsp:Transcript_17995/g.53329  ORF Transcript_17995/g.53329 Transcript_17995/m.53329 type:complete len:259 (-) Transcript_17995:229-1005(-)
MPERASPPETPTPATPQTPGGTRVPRGDLTVTFDDGSSVESHSVILALASPVFSALLTTPSGALRTDLHLAGASADEFRDFSIALRPAGLRQSALQDEARYSALVRWAHKYEADSLKTLIEDHLIKDVPVKTGSLAHALSYSLLRRRAQCLKAMVADLREHVEELGLLAKRETLQEMETVWPRLCEAAGVPLYPMPPVEQLETMWPFVAAGIRQHAVSASEHLQAGLSKAAKSAVADASATLSETSTSLLDRFMAYWV